MVFVNNFQTSESESDGATCALMSAQNDEADGEMSLALPAAASRKDRSDSLKENHDELDRPAAEQQKQKQNAKRPLNHSLSAPVFPGYEASAAAAASVPSLAASWMIDHQPVSWSPGMMRPHAAGVMTPYPARSAHFPTGQACNARYLFQPLDPPSSGSTTTFGMLHSYLDPSHNRRFGQRRASDPEQLRRSRLRQLRRQLSNVRKRMEEVQLDFEQSLGYRPSQVLACYVWGGEGNDPHIDYHDQ